MKISDDAKGDRLRLARLARVVARAEEVLGDERRAALWVHRPNLALPGGRTPVSLLDTDEGADAVLRALGRLAHGVFS